MAMKPLLPRASVAPAALAASALPPRRRMSFAEHGAKVRELVSMAEGLRCWWCAEGADVGDAKEQNLGDEALQEIVIRKIVAFKDGLDEIVDSGADLNVYQMQHHGEKPINHHQQAIFWLSKVYATVRGRVHRLHGIPGEERVIAWQLGLPALEPYIGPDEPAAIEKYVKENWPAITERMDSLAGPDLDFIRDLEDERIKAVDWEEHKEREERLAAALSGNPIQAAQGSYTVDEVKMVTRKEYHPTPESKRLIKDFRNGASVNDLSDKYHKGAGAVRQTIRRARKAGLLTPAKPANVTRRD